MRTPSRVGLRRDITLFMAALAIFFVCIIAILLVALQMSVARAEESARARWDVAADAIAERISSANVTSAGAADSMLVWARTRFDAAGIELRRGDDIARSGISGSDLATVKREIGGAQLTVWFDDSALRTHRTTFYAIAAISLFAASVTTIVVLLYVPKIVGPIESMLEQARRVGDDEGAATDEAGYVIRTFRDTIERLESREQELRDLHEREKTRADELERISATLTRSLSSGFLSVGPDGRIAELNNAGAQILGVSAQDMIGRVLEDAIGEPLSAVVRRSLDESHAFTRLELQQDAAGEPVDLGVTTVPLRGADDRTLGVLALFTNLTPIRELEDRVRALQTLADLGEMAAGVAHEFRNSLSTISGYLKLALRHDVEQPVEAKLKAAEEESVRLSAAVAALLNFARPFRLDVQRVNLAEVARTTAAPLSENADAAPITVDAEDVVIEADPTLLARAVENGLRNAIASVREKGTGTISVVVRAEPQPRIVIADTGTGLETADVSRLFLPFQSDRAGGFGLGLSLIKKIVLLHHGDVDLQGKAGEGATLTMTFPRE